MEVYKAILVEDTRRYKNKLSKKDNETWVALTVDFHGGQGV